MASGSTHEATRIRRRTSWSADWDNPKISLLLKAIVGFELSVEHWEGKSKLGQNWDFQDQESLKVHLQNSEDASRNKLAEVMK